MDPRSPFKFPKPLAIAKKQPTLDKVKDKLPPKRGERREGDKLPPKKAERSTLEMNVTGGYFLDVSDAGKLNVKRETGEVGTKSDSFTESLDFGTSSLVNPDQFKRDIPLGKSNRIMGDVEGGVKSKKVADIRDAGETKAPSTKSDTLDRRVTPIPNVLNPLETSTLPKKLEKLNDQMKQPFIGKHDTKAPLKPDVTGKRRSEKFDNPTPSKLLGPPIVKKPKTPPLITVKNARAGLKQLVDFQKQEIKQLRGKLEEKREQLGSVLKEDQKHANRTLGLLEDYENNIDEINKKCKVTLEKLEAAKDDRRALQKRLKELENLAGKEKHLLTEAKTGENDAMTLGVLTEKNKDLKKKSKERDLRIQSHQNEIGDIESKLREKPNRVKSHEDKLIKGACVCDELERRLRPDEEKSDKEKNDKELKSLKDSNKKLQDQLDLSAQRHQQKLRNDINSTRSKCEDEIDKLTTENADAMKQLESNRNEFKATQQKIRRDLDALRLDNERLKAEIQHVKANLNAKQTKANEELQKSKLDNTDLQHKLKMSTEALKVLKDSLKEPDNLIAENSKLKNKRDTLDRKLDDLAANEHKIDELKAANEDLRNQIRALEEKLEGATPDDSFMHFVAPEEMTRFYSTKVAPLTFSHELLASNKEYSLESRQSDALTETYDKERYLSARVSSLSVLEDHSTSEREYSSDNRLSVDKRSTKPQVRINEDEKDPVRFNSKIELLYRTNPNTSNELDNTYLPKENKDESMALPVKNKDLRPSKATTFISHSNDTKRVCLGAPRQIPDNSSSKRSEILINRTPVPENKLQKDLKTSPRTWTICPHGRKMFTK